MKKYVQMSVSNKIILLISVFFSLFAWAAPYIANNFYIESKKIFFNNKTKRVKCTGEIPYPYLSNSDQELSDNINDKIYDFAETYAICNHGSRSHYQVSFEVPESGTSDILSVLWKTVRYNQLERIDVINLNARTGELISMNDIFHIHSNNLVHEIAKLSQGRLNIKTSWRQFLQKIESRDIQLYLKDGDWYIVFNETALSEGIFETKLPQYFLGHRENND